MSNVIRHLTTTSVIVGFSAAAASAALAGGMETRTTVHRFADASVVENAEAALFRSEHGISAQLDTTELTEGDAVTMWWVVFNSPEMCSGDECGEDDILNIDADGEIIPNDDGSMPFNEAGLEAADVSINYADGHVVDVGGAATFRAQLPAGDTFNTLLGPGLVDPMTAEVHLILRTHQKAMPGQVDEMIHTINGGCDEAFPNAPCEDLQFAVFKPAN